MALSATAIAIKFASLVANAPNKTTFTFGTKTDCTAVKTTLAKEISYGIAGYSNDYKFSLICSLNQFSTVPDVEGVITIGSTIYRIIGTEKDSCDITIRLDLADRYEG